MPSVLLFSSLLLHLDGANAYIDIYDFNLTLGNTSAETLMGYALWEGCTQPCNMPLFSLSNSGTPDLEMVAFGGITVNGTYYDDQVGPCVLHVLNIGSTTRRARGGDGTDYAGELGESLDCIPHLISNGSRLG